jgi:4-amino-4-deoxy-L-arabinose transferase-like glycosyltransferase
MMFNRAARFVYRDQANWLGSFSPRMDPIFHADYPLFLAMNIASSWDTLGSETPHVPMAQSALFAVASAGLMVTALGRTKSIGQAALGLIVFWGTPAVVNEGARELADLPLAYFFLATAVLIYLYVLNRQAGLLVLAGLTAGLAAWVKNEGSVFLIAGALAVGAAFLRERPWRKLVWYALGAAAPLAIVLYFKLVLAPPSDVLSNGPGRSIAQALELSRHLEILRFMGTELLSFGGWSVRAVPIGAIAVLLVYLLLTRPQLVPQQRLMLVATVVLFGVQMLGTYAVYLITPYDLTWHLTYSIERIFLQVFPLLAFAILSAARSPEAMFQRS